MSTARNDSSLSQIAADLDTELSEIFSTTQRLADAVLALWSAERDVLDQADLGTLDGLITDELRTHPYYSGCGFVADLDIVHGSHRYWQWLTTDNNPDTQPYPLPLQTGAEGGETYSYENMEWFRVAAAGAAVAVGPYMDFAGADRLVLTFAGPVAAPDRLLGVSGADIPLSAFEGRLRRHLKKSTARLAVLNREGRVIVSTTADAVPTERLATYTVDQVAFGPESVGWRLCSLPA